MAVFTYQAVDVDARQLTGAISADSARAARDLLRQKGLAIESIQESRPVASSSQWWRRGKSKAVEVTSFIRDLSTLLTAGIPLLEAIDTQMEQFKRGFRSSILALREKVSAGASLHEAMQELPALFDPMCVSLAEVGQNTGTLEEALSRLADYRERSEQTKSKVLTALIYPVIVSAIGISVTIFLMTFVVPQLLGTLIDSGKPLPLPTVIIKAVSDFLIGWWWLLLLLVGVAAVALRISFKKPATKRFWDRLLLKLPLLGTVARKEIISQMSVVLSTLLRSGLPFDQSLAITRRTIKNSAFRNALEQCEAAVQAGAELSTPLRQSEVFPPTVVQIIAVGQQSGELETMLERLAKGFEQQVAVATARMMSALEPLIIVLLAVLVGFVALATILPILEASNVF